MTKKRFTKWIKESRKYFTEEVGNYCADADDVIADVIGVMENQGIMLTDEDITQLENEVRGEE